MEIFLLGQAPLYLARFIFAILSVICIVSSSSVKGISIDKLLRSLESSVYGCFWYFWVCGMTGHHCDRTWQDHSTLSGIAVYIFDSKTCEAEAGELQVPGKPTMYRWLKRGLSK